MATFETFFKAIVKDIAVELTDEFDRNFERKAFFNEKWPEDKWANQKGSLMNRSGGLRRSVKKQVTEEGMITWSSSRKDAALHNDGGEITVTAKMKKFFWAMYYKSANAITYNVKKKAANNTKRNQKLSGEAAIWKSMALMKLGSKIKIPRRRFIGSHPKVDGIIKGIITDHLKHLETYMNQLLNPKGLGVRNVKFK